MTDMDKLIAAVEAGLPSPTNWRNFAALGGDDADDTPFSILAHRAYHGSLDAALRLHEALLPGWHLSELSQAPDPSEYPGLDWVAAISARASPASVESCAATPARAWLLAILRALKAKGDA